MHGGLGDRQLGNTGARRVGIVRVLDASRGLDDKEQRPERDAVAVGQAVAV